MIFAVLYLTLVETRHYLATSTTRTIERDVVNTMRRYDISYTREGETTIEHGEVGATLILQGPAKDKQRVVKMKIRVKSSFKLKKG